MRNYPAADRALLDRLETTLAGPLARFDFAQLARFNRSYLRYQADPFGMFVANEWPYYRQVLAWYRASVPRGARVLEVGTFVPTVPLLLAWEGYEVTTVERLAFYGSALDEVVALLPQHGITFLDADIVTDTLPIAGLDAVNLLAVVEHLAGSPKVLLERLRVLLRPGGSLVFAVPNQATLMRRLLLLLKGTSVHPPFEDYYESEYPFTGHHREYTWSEMHHALTRAGFHVTHAASIHYPPSAEAPLSARLLTGMQRLLPHSFQQGLFAVATPAETAP